LLNGKFCDKFHDTAERSALFEEGAANEKLDFSPTIFLIYMIPHILEGDF